MKFDKTQLLNILKENREKHIETAKTAYLGYLNKLKERVSKIQFDVDEALVDTTKVKKIDCYVNLAHPEDHTGEYDRVIRMLELTTQDEIELSEKEFSMYVLDEWSWRGSFVKLSNFYNGTEE